MGIGASIFLVAVGAILAFAVTADVQGIDIATVGWILMIVGIVGFLLSLLFWSTWGGVGTRRRETVVRQDPYNRPPYWHSPPPHPAKGGAMPPFASADNEHLVTEIADFGEIVLIVAGGLTLALLSTKLNERIPIPAPGIFLVAAAILSDVIPSIGDHVSIRTVERIGVIALIVILFDGGMEVGWRRFRASAWPITALGIFGTFASAGLIAVAGHYLFGFSWTIAGIIGAALAPTDPAVMFSVLGNREVGGAPARSSRSPASTTRWASP